MEKIMIKGKPYVQVNQRVLELRHKYGDKDNMFGIKTKVVKWNEEKNEIIIQAWITDKTGRIVGSGIAHEEKTQTGVNSTSYVENCETSAIGRALAAFGLGIEDAYSSADEVQQAIKKQTKKKEKVSEDRNENLTDMMDSTQEASVDPYFIQYRTALAKVFIEGADSKDATELLEFVLADFNEDATEEVIQAHAHANPVNKEVLKQYCEEHISLWKSTMNSKDYDGLVIFMKYLSGKFPEEVA